MSSHNERTELEGIRINGGRMFYFVSGVPSDSIAGYAKGCLAIDLTNGYLYQNRAGTVTSATWEKVGTQS